MEQEDLIALLREVQANQQSLHDDIAAVVERMASLEKTVTEAMNNTPEPPAVDAHQQYLAARALVIESGKCSTSFLQRILRIGYSNAARIIDLLEENGVVGPQNGATPREILMTMEALDEIENAEYEATQQQWALLNPDADNGDVTDEDLYDEAKKAVIEAGKCSTSYLQRKLRIGYSRAARLVDMLEERGVIGPQDGMEPREVKA